MRFGPTPITSSRSYGGTDSSSRPQIQISRTWLLPQATSSRLSKHERSAASALLSFFWISPLLFTDARCRFFSEVVAARSRLHYLRYQIQNAHRCILGLRTARMDVGDQIS